MSSFTRFLPTWSWMATFVAFPVAGLAGRAVGGPVDAFGAALAGGVVTGAVIGLAQAVAARGALGPVLRWAAASALGYGAGLAAGAALVGYATSTGALAAMGAVTGVLTGAAAFVVLLADGRRRLATAWAAAAPVLLALGWAVTSAVGVDVEEHYTVFGATGALVVTALSGVLVRHLGTEAQRPPVPSATLPSAAGS